MTGMELKSWAERSEARAVSEVISTGCEADGDCMYDDERDCLPRFEPSCPIRPTRR